MSDEGDVNDRPPRLAHNGPLRAAIDAEMLKHAATIAAAPQGTSVEGSVELSDGTLLGKVRLEKRGERAVVWVEPVVAWQMKQQQGPAVKVTFGGRW